MIFRSVPALLVLGILACSSSNSVAPPDGAPRVALLQLTVPQPIELRDGESTTITVRPLDSSGRLIAAAVPLVQAVSTDPSVVDRVQGPGAVVPAQAESDASFTFRAVGPGMAVIRVTYPCAPATAGCIPEHTIDVGVTVNPAVTGLRVAPPEGGIVAVGESRIISVQAVAADGTPVPGPDLAITAESLDPPILGVEVAAGTPGDGAIEVTLRGLSQGSAVLRLDHPEIPEPLELLVLVVPRSVQVVVDPAGAALVPGDRLILTIRALDAAGAPVPNAEIGFDVESSDPAVVAVVGVLDPTPGDGSLQVTVEARQIGQADVIVHYPGVAQVVVRISVQTVVAGPSIDQIPGGYNRTGALVEDACGGAPTSIENPPGALIRVAKFDDDLTMTVGLETYTGGYDPSTGAWEASAIVQEGGENVRKTHSGNWRTSGGGIVFRGTLVIEPLNPDGSVRCTTRYAVEYERL